MKSGLEKAQGTAARLGVGYVEGVKMPINGLVRKRDTAKLPTTHRLSTASHDDERGLIIVAIHDLRMARSEMGH